MRSSRAPSLRATAAASASDAPLAGGSSTRTTTPPARIASRSSTRFPRASGRNGRTVMACERPNPRARRNAAVNGAR